MGENVLLMTLSNKIEEKNIIVDIGLKNMMESFLKNIIINIIQQFF